MSSGSLSLPSEFVGQSFDRLAYLAAIYAVTFAIAAFGFPDGDADPGSIISNGTYQVIGWMFVTGAVLLFAGIKSGKLKPCHINIHGAGFEIIGAIGINIGLLTWDGNPADVTANPGWTSVWILCFPLFMPTRPRFTLITSLVTASVLPATLLLLKLLGGNVPSVIQLLPAVIPAYICAGIATFASKVIHRLGQDVTAAKRMGSYVLKDKLGFGGMGEVWRAEHRLLARPSAIKLIKTEGMLEAQREIQLERFEREVQSTARLTSPHTIDVHDYGRTSDGTFYYVMELLDGLNLDELVQKHGQQHPARVVRILQQMCHSLGEAHEKGIIHRDLKPANIFLCRQGRDVDVVKILDFGLVKLDQPGVDQDSSLTQAGHFIGTPTYAAPEMANGEINKIGSRTDIYQMGCVAFWLLTGRPVFEADNMMKMLVAHADKQPDAPSTHAEHSVPAALDTIVLKCLEKELDDRYANVDELNEALSAVQTECTWKHDKADAWWCGCGIEPRKTSVEEATVTEGPEGPTIIEPVAPAD
jgi:hypothetical protein